MPKLPEQKPKVVKIKSSSLTQSADELEKKRQLKNEKARETKRAQRAEQDPSLELASLYQICGVRTMPQLMMISPGDTTASRSKNEDGASALAREGSDAANAHEGE